MVIDIPIEQESPPWFKRYALRLKSNISGLTTTDLKNVSVVPAAYANDSAAATGGVPVGGVYANSSFGNCLTVRRS